MSLSGRRSDPSCHLTHQWSQISTYAFGNHKTCHHTYSKNTHVHIQVFQILHNHTMKLLQAFKLFLTWMSAIKIDSRNWFVDDLEFSSENWFSNDIGFDSKNWFTGDPEFDNETDSLLIQDSTAKTGSLVT
jgi:hypothetical protein